MALFIASTSIALSQANTATFCPPPPRETVIIRSVLNYNTLILTDGRTIRLAGIAIAEQDAEPAARAALTKAVTGKTLNLHPLGTTDRWGRLFAHPHTQDGQSIEGQLIIQGLAHAAAHTPQACIETFLQQERIARAAHLGLWQRKGYERRTFPAEILAASTGHHIIAQGTVKSTRIFGNRMYINFAHPWHQALSLSVSLKEAAAVGIPVKDTALLTGKSVRARGFLEWERGPVIRLAAPETVEWLATAQGEP